MFTRGLLLSQVFFSKRDRNVCQFGFAWITRVLRGLFLGILADVKNLPTITYLGSIIWLYNWYALYIMHYLVLFTGNICKICNIFNICNIWFEIFNMYCILLRCNICNNLYIYIYEINDTPNICNLSIDHVINDIDSEMYNILYIIFNA